MTFKAIFLLSVFMLFCFMGISQPKSNANNAKINSGKHSSVEDEDVPGWISDGCETFWTDKSEDHLCAIGLVAGSTSKAELRTSAERQARIKIERILQPIVLSLIENYASTSSGHNDFGKPPDLEHVRNIATFLTQISVLESRIVSVFLQDNGQMYVLVSLNTSGFRAAVQALPDLSDDLRKELVKRTENGFKKIDKK